LPAPLFHPCFRSHGAASRSKVLAFPILLMAMPIASNPYVNIVDRVCSTSLHYIILRYVKLTKRDAIP
jgi:hypothetical protein